MEFNIKLFLFSSNFLFITFSRCDRRNIFLFNDFLQGYIKLNNLLNEKTIIIEDKLTRKKVTPLPESLRLAYTFPQNYDPEVD